MVLNGHYDVRLVALSYGIACAGSYLALRVAQQPRSAEPVIAGPPFRAINAPAAILGFAIWSMHFTGMAAFHLDGVPMGYRVDLTLLSLFVAMVFTWFGFATLWLARHLPDGFAMAGALMGCGILTMHYTGMAAMTGDMVQSYDVGLAALSAVIAIAPRSGRYGSPRAPTMPYNASARPW